MEIKGAGPAGISTALKLARSGLKIAIFDKEVFLHQLPHESPVTPVAARILSRGLLNPPVRRSL